MNDAPSTAVRAAASADATEIADAGPLTPVALRATYRLQLHAGFGLRAAMAIVPYLARLGISHVYASPLLRSRAGSTHGYDVVDPTRLDPELGTDEDLAALVRALRARGMGLVLDIVPNHMGVASDNPFLEDLLTHGRAARHAPWFDVDWEAPEPRLRGRVVLPVLGDRLDDVIERGEIALAWEDARGLRVRYGDDSFPVDPSLIPRVIAPALESLRAARGDDADVRELAELRGALLELPPRTTSIPERVEQRQLEAPRLVRRLVELRARAPDLRTALDVAVRRFDEGETGKQRLRTFLDSLPYALVHWRRGAREINYRRFFDINELVALRAEDAEVFGRTHRLVMQWVKDGLLDGLRVDHVDGLLDPLGYLRRLRATLEQVRGDEVGSAFPVLVEKVLSPGERLRESWPVQGTTGYDFLNEVEGLFVAPAGRAAIEEAYRKLIGVRAHAIGFAAVAYRGKVHVLRWALGPDVQRLVRLLAPIARRAMPGEAPGPAQLAEAIVQVIARLPVYRTYVDPREDAVSPEDRRLIEDAVARVRAGRDAPPLALDLVRDVLLLAGWESFTPEERRARMRFVQRWQQTTGPAVAKGVEDTALYRWVPLVSLNEVGGDPDRPLDDAAARVHRANADRASDWPRTLLAVNTHDTKRSADVRARIDVLSEMPDEWTAVVSRWRKAHRALRTRVRHRSAPDANAEYLLYQTLVGMWVPGAGARERDALRERVQAYMIKALREAKALTSWTDPDEAYERAVAAFIDALFADERGFLPALESLVAHIAPAGTWNALARVVVHTASPGVPDVYQGDELWNHALVDPDNRRDVDWSARERLLAELETSPPDAARLRALLATPADDRLKLHVLHAALAARAAHPALRAGGYEPLVPRGQRAPHVFTFARRASDSAAIAVVPRLTLSLAPDGAPPIADVWSDTTIPLPSDLSNSRWRCVLSGREVDADEGGVRLARALAVLPVALLVNDRDAG